MPVPMISRSLADMSSIERSRKAFTFLMSASNVLLVMVFASLRDSSSVPEIMGDPSRTDTATEPRREFNRDLLAVAGVMSILRHHPPQLPSAGRGQEFSLYSSAHRSSLPSKPCRDICGRHPP